MVVVEVVDGRVDVLKKRSWMGFDVVDDATQQGVRSTGCTFILMSAERSCIE